MLSNQAQRHDLPESGAGDDGHPSQPTATFRSFGVAALFVAAIVCTVALLPKPQSASASIAPTAATEVRHEAPAFRDGPGLMARIADAMLYVCTPTPEYTPC